MRVALVSSGLVPVPPVRGGAVEGYVYQLCRHLRKLSIEASVIDSSHTNKPGVYEVNGCPIIRIETPDTPKNMPRRDILRELVFGYRVAGSIERDGFDIIHINTAWTGFAAVRRLRGKRIVYTCHNPFWPQESVHLGEKVVRIVEGHVMRNSARVIALNRTMYYALRYRARIPSEKLSIVPLGVDTEYFRPDISTSQVNERYGLEGKIVILFVGRISPVKGVHVLLKAYRLLLEKGMRDLKLVIAGPYSGTFTKDTVAHYARNVLEYARRNLPPESYTFTGAIDKEILRQLYTRADIFVLPSYAEAFGTVLLEAMASGTPVIGSRAGGVVDVIEHGINGFLFNRGDPLDLAEKLYLILSDRDLHEKLGRNARRIAEQRYSWQCISLDLKRIYEHLQQNIF